MGFKWGDGDRTECAYIVWDDVYNMILNSTCHDENKLPQAEFLSRAAVTAKKLWAGGEGRGAVEAGGGGVGSRAHVRLRVR
jgi:hypothetical protein